MKRPRLLDENYGKEVYERGSFSEGFYNYYEAFGLCQHLIWKLGYGFQRCKTYLTEFSKKSDPSFNEVKSLDRINIVIKRAEKKKPDDFPTVVVTEKEMENISKIKNFKYQKFLFSILVYAKRYKFDTTNQRKKKDILGYHLSRQKTHDISVDIGMKISLSNIGLFLTEFHYLGMIDGAMNEYISILYSEDNSIPMLEVKGVEYPWLIYIDYFSGEQIFCDNCKKMIKKEKVNQKYCKICGEIKRKEFARNRKRKQRNKIKIIGHAN